MRVDAVAVCVCLLSGCNLPRDAGGTLQRVRGGTMRVGIIANVPWVIDRGDAVQGIEGSLASSIAASLGAHVNWVRMPEFELMRALHDRQLDLVIGGFDDGIPWVEEVAFTRPYLTSRDGKAHVLAAPPGENDWLMLLDTELERRQATIATSLGEAPQ